MQRVVVVMSVFVALLVSAGTAAAVPPLWELQPLPGWTCEGAGEMRTCSTEVAAGDATVACAQWDELDFTVDQYRTGTRCSVGGADGTLVACEDSSNTEFIGPSESVQECAAGSERAGCAGHGYNSGIGPGGHSSVSDCGATVAGTRARCVDDFYTASGSEERKFDCGVAAGDGVTGCGLERSDIWQVPEDVLIVRCGSGETQCEVRVDQLRTSPVVTPACPAPPRP